ncbi:MAG: endopeptidase La [Clostridia bacterium]|nr:endopeptidase La [Clostridia bacterium]
MAKLPMIALRGLVAFPGTSLQFDLKRDISIKALNYAVENHTRIFLMTQDNPLADDVSEGSFHGFGTIAEIKHVISLPGTMMRVMTEGKSRAKVISFDKFSPFIMADVDELPSVVCDEVECEALFRQVKERALEYAKLNPKLGGDIEKLLRFSESCDEFSDMLAHTLPYKYKKHLLDEINLVERMYKIQAILDSEIEILKTETKIAGRVKTQIDKSQKEYYLREQIKAIHEELGDVSEETDALREKLEKLNAPDEVKNHFMREWKRMQNLTSMSPETSILRTYLEYVCDLPWGVYTEDNISLVRAREVLDEDHYALDKLKERIVEYLAVRQMTNKGQGTILCLVGPPGVGKTSIAKSIARALGRNYIRMSLGGVHDEAEIRGHRKTYVGAMPGRIISGMKNAKSMNPVFLLDEIDKMSSDYKGDPSSAMLEVLDSEQNDRFSDNYMEIPFDLSKVMFIATANYADQIPAPLLDRMEIVDMTGYTEEEKEQIAIRHLIPKQLDKHGLTDKQLKFNKKSVKTLINDYTRESGVRQLEREIASVCRKAVKDILSSSVDCVKADDKKVKEYLGVARYHRSKKSKIDTIGLANGLAWTAVGGETLSVEVTLMKGKGDLSLTGHLGDVMKESAITAFSFIKANAERLGVDDETLKSNDVHVHVPAGAIPKDGPSAGITLATAILSTLTNRPIKANVAMTGEITLLGRVLAIGGLKEKTLAAVREGIDTVIVPKENEKDVTELPETVKEKLKFVYATKAYDVFKEALV